MSRGSLSDLLGRMDIYLVDQVMKGRVTPSMRILDAGCGGGRNLTYLAREGAQVWGIDESAVAVEEVRARIGGFTDDPEERFRRGSIDETGFPDRFFDVVICSAVLHFCRDPHHFRRCMDELWRVLRPGGLFFARLASTIGIEDRVEPRGDGWYGLPDGSDRFLVDEGMLVEETERLGGLFLEPIKTTNVQGLRCMSTWVLRKPDDGDRALS